MIRFLRSLGAWSLLALLVGLAVLLEQRRSPAETIASGENKAIHVIDGDSLRVDGREIRLGGIDAPEYRQTCKDAAGMDWPCGHEARAAMERLVAAGGLVCRKSAEDRYGRALSTCRTKGGDLAEALARAGWAEGAGDPRFTEPQAAIAEARRAKRGIWRGTHQRPAEWRKVNAPS